MHKPDDFSNLAELQQRSDDISLEMQHAQGALEAVGDFISVGEPYALPEYQQRLVDLIKSRNAGSKDKTVAVMDLATGNEGFMEVVDAIGRKAIKSMIANVPKLLDHTATTLMHYCNVAETTAARLRQLQPQLKKAGSTRPSTEIFDFGAHRRFMQCNGVELVHFDEFVDTFKIQSALAMHGYVQGANYSIHVAERIISDLTKLQNPQNKDLREDLKKSIIFHWTNVWRDGFTIAKPGKVPKEYLAEHPDCKVYSICPLFDARMLCAVEPRSSKDLNSVGKFTASLAFDKKSEVKPSGQMALPYTDSMLPLVDEAVMMLTNMRHYKELSKKCSKLSKEFEKAFKTIENSLDERMSPVALENAINYMRMVVTCTQTMTQPHNELAWMHVRSGLVVAAMAEQTLFESGRELVVSSKFFNKESLSRSFALEGYVETSTLLAACVASYR